MTAKVRYTNVAESPVAQHTAAGRSLMIYDAVGSTIQMYNASGTVTDSIRYWPYGEVADSTGGAQSGLLFAGREGYQSQQLLAYVRNRFLNLTTGRWITRDPVWPIESPYAYVMANPMTHSDPSGLGCASCCCEPTGLALRSSSVKKLGGASSSLDTSDKSPRYGHYFEITFATDAGNVNSSFQADCDLKWYECSNFELDGGGKAGSWQDQTSLYLSTVALGSEDWRRRQFDCNSNRATSGVLKDEPSLTKTRLEDLFNKRKKKITRYLLIVAIVRGGAPSCTGCLSVSLNQEISFDGAVFVEDLRLGLPTRPSTFCPNEPKC